MKLPRLKRLAAFTIVELMVAVAISAILAAIALPAYNRYVAQQQFDTQAQKIADCWQQAENAVSSPGEASSYRYAGASLSAPNSSQPSSLQCTVCLYDTTAQLSTLVSGATPACLTPIKTIGVQGISLGNATLAGSAISAVSSVNVYFDALSHPSSQAASVCNASQCVTAVPPPYTTGISLSLALIGGSDATSISIAPPLGAISLQNF